MLRVILDDIGSSRPKWNKNREKRGTDREGRVLKKKKKWRRWKRRNREERNSRNVKFL